MAPFVVLNLCADIPIIRVDAKLPSISLIFPVLFFSCKFRGTINTKHHEFCGDVIQKEDMINVKFAGYLRQCKHMKTVCHVLKDFV